MPSGCVLILTSFISIMTSKGPDLLDRLGVRVSDVHASEHGNVPANGGEGPRLVVEATLFGQDKADR
jgi:hypothetical protein